MLGSLPFLSLLLYLIAAIMALLVLVAGLKRPWFATVAAITSIAFVPFWTGANVSVFFVSVHMLLVGLALVALALVGVADDEVVPPGEPPDSLPPDQLMAPPVAVLPGPTVSRVPSE